MKNHTTRRTLLKQLAAGSLAVTGLSTMQAFANDTDERPLKGNINHSVCSWTFSHLSLDELCLAVKMLGFNAIDLVAPKDWPVLKKHGIYCSMCYTDGEISLTHGWNDSSLHPTLVRSFSDAIPLVAQAGYKNLICFSGNRHGMDDDTGMKNCVEGLKQIMPLAEKHGVVIQMELFNSKVDHKDYMCDKSAWGIALCKKLGSPNFKLLYDIYHMQINEGDVIRTIRDNHEYFGHYHTAGVPGRNEIDEKQELYYPAIMKAILDTGYKGYVAQEFISTGKTNEDKLAALKRAVATCDV